MPLLPTNKIRNSTGNNLKVVGIEIGNTSEQVKLTLKTRQSDRCDN